MKSLSDLNPASKTEKSAAKTNAKDDSMGIASSDVEKKSSGERRTRMVVKPNLIVRADGAKKHVSSSNKHGVIMDVEMVLWRLFISPGIR